MASKIERFFYRCEDCLTVVATNKEIMATRNERGYLRYAICGACEGRIEFMGRVERERLWTTGHECPCDGRCTGASGPSCDCQCGGKNHGTGRVVEVEKCAGGLPRVMTPPDAKQKADEYLALCEQYEAAWTVKYGEITERKRAGEYIGNFGFFLEGQYEWKAYSKACSLRTHAGRNKSLKALIAGITPKKTLAYA
jgi:hypothetical protein